MADKKTRTLVSLEEKLAIYQFKEIFILKVLDFPFELLKWKIALTMKLSQLWHRKRADELIVFEEVVSGDIEVTIAIPSEIKVRNVKKRKQPAITDYFAKN